MNETRKLFWAILILVPLTVFAVPIWLAGGSIDGGLAILAGWVATGFASIAPAFMSLPYWPLWFGLITLGLGVGIGILYVKGKLFLRWGSRGTNALVGSGGGTQSSTQSSEFSSQMLREQQEAAKEKAMLEEKT